MEAIILAAGRGTRLKPLTNHKPKALVTVAGRPLLADCLDQLVSVGVDRIVVVVGYEGDQIVEEFGDDHRGATLEYVEQDDRDGVASALLAAEDEMTEEQFLVMLGDNVFRANLGAVVRAIDEDRAGSADGAVLVEDVPEAEASRYGVCRLDEDGEVEEIVEKPDDPPSTLVATGFYAFTSDVFDACRRIEPSDRGEYEISDAITVYADTHEVETVTLAGWRVDVGYPADRTEAHRRLLGERPEQPAQGASASGESGEASRGSGEASRETGEASRETGEAARERAGAAESFD